MHYLVQGDSGSQIKATLTREDTGDAVDLSTKTTLLKVKARNGSSVLFEIAGTNISASDGIVLYQFGTNLDTLEKGYYEGEIEVTNNDSTIESVYELIQFSVREDF